MVRKKAVSTTKKKIITNKPEKKEDADLSLIEETFQNYVEDLVKTEEKFDVCEQIPIRTSQIHNKPNVVENQNKLKKVRFNLDVRVLKEIKKYQTSTELLIPRASFARVCREIFAQYGNPELRIARIALECLQEATENYLVQCFEDAYLCAAHANRKTLLTKDLRLARRIGGRSGFYM